MSDPEKDPSNASEAEHKESDDDWEMVEDTCVDPEPEVSANAGASDGWQRVRRRRRRVIRPLLASSTTDDVAPAEDDRVVSTEPNAVVWSTLAHQDTVESTRPTENADEVLIPENGELRTISLNDTVLNGGGESRRRPRRLTRYPAFIPPGQNSIGSNEWFHDDDGNEADDEMVSLFDEAMDELRNERANLIREQDLAFEEALAEDRRKDEERKVAAEQEQERQELEERERLEKVEQHRKLAEEAEKRLPDEPAEDDRDIVTMRIHTGDGVLDRRFSLKDPCSALYDFMTSQGIFDVVLETNDREVITSSKTSLGKSGFKGRIGIWTRYPEKDDKE